MRNSEAKIVFYDGDCGLCQRSIQLLISLDSAKKLKFAPLNGETYLNLFSSKSDKNSVVFFQEGQFYYKSDAFIYILNACSPWWRPFFLFLLVPRILRDGLYDFIAKHRTKVTCILISKDERFLP